MVSITLDNKKKPHLPHDDRRDDDDDRAERVRHDVEKDAAHVHVAAAAAVGMTVGRLRRRRLALLARVHDLVGGREIKARVANPNPDRSRWIGKIFTGSVSGLYPGYVQL